MRAAAWTPTTPAGERAGLGGRLDIRVGRGGEGPGRRHGRRAAHRVGAAGGAPPPCGTAPAAATVSAGVVASGRTAGAAAASVVVNFSTGLTRRRRRRGPNGGDGLPAEAAAVAAGVVAALVTATGRGRRRRSRRGTCRARRRRAGGQSGAASRGHLRGAVVGRQQSDTARTPTARASRGRPLPSTRRYHRGQQRGSRVRRRRRRRWRAASPSPPPLRRVHWQQRSRACQQPRRATRARPTHRRDRWHRPGVADVATAGKGGRIRRGSLAPPRPTPLVRSAAVAAHRTPSARARTGWRKGGKKGGGGGKEGGSGDEAQTQPTAGVPHANGGGLKQPRRRRAM